MLVYSIKCIIFGKQNNKTMKAQQYEELKQWLVTRDYTEDFEDGQINSSFEKQYQEKYEIYFDFKIWESSTHRKYFIDVFNLSVTNLESIDEELLGYQKTDIYKALEDIICPEWED